LDDRVKDVLQAFRVGTAHAFVQFVATREDRAFARVMTLVGRRIPKCAMAVRLLYQSAKRAIQSVADARSANGRRGYEQAIGWGEAQAGRLPFGDRSRITFR